MTAKYSANTNTNDESTQDTVSVDSTTAQIALPARPENEPIQEASISNMGNKILWLREYPASQDNLKHGKPVDPGATHELRLPNIQIGECSVIFESGGAKDVVIQYR